MLTQENKNRSVRSISKEKAEEIKDFLQGAIRRLDFSMIQIRGRFRPY